MSAPQHFTTEEKINISNALNKFGLTYQIMGHYSPSYRIDLEGNMNIQINAVKNYSDTTGVVDFTGIVFTVWKNGHILKTFTSLVDFVSGYPQIELEVKRVRADKRLNDMSKDFNM